MLSGGGTRSSCQDGFTLVEALVAMILLAIALTVSMPALVETSKSGARSASSAITQGGNSAALSMLESDLRAMRAPLRGFGDDDLADSNIIEQLSQFNTYRFPGSAGYDRTGSPAYLPATPSTHDIVFAGPRMVEFWADVMDVDPFGNPSVYPDDRAELVRWYLTGRDGLDQEDACGGGNRWCVVRDVRYGPGAGRVVSEVVTAGRGALPRTGCSQYHDESQYRLFCFSQRVVTNGGYNDWDFSPVCEDRWVTSMDPNQMPTTDHVYPARGRNRGGMSIGNPDYRIRVQHSSGTSHQIHALDRISTVGVVLPTSASLGKGDDVTVTTSKVELRSRQGTEYQTAILCGAR